MGIFWEPDKISAGAKQTSDVSSSTQYGETFTITSSEDQVKYYGKIATNVSETSRAYRAVNELIASQMARIIILKLTEQCHKQGIPAPIVIPKFDCIFTTNADGDIIAAGNASSLLPDYAGLQEEDNHFSEKTTMLVLQKMIDLRVGVVQALRLFLGDPDAANNIGLYPPSSKTSLAILDFGLADFFKLKADGHLNDDEQNRLDNDSPASLLEMNTAKVMFGFVPHKDPKFLSESTLHVVPEEYGMGMDTWSELPERYLMNLSSDYYQALDMIEECFHGKDLATVILSSLSEDEQGDIAIQHVYDNNPAFHRLFDEVIASYTKKVNTLNMTLSANYDRGQFEAQAEKLPGLPKRLKAVKYLSTNDEDQHSALESLVPQCATLALVADCFANRKNSAATTNILTPQKIAPSLAHSLWKSNPKKHQDNIERCVKFESKCGKENTVLLAEIQAENAVTISQANIFRNQTL